MKRPWVGGIYNLRILKRYTSAMDEAGVQWYTLTNRHNCLHCILYLPTHEVLNAAHLPA